MRAVVALVLAFLSGTAPVEAEEIRIATQSQSNVGIEISTRIMAEAYRRLGHTMVLVSFPLERSLLEANRGLVDGELYRQAGMTALYPNLRQVPVVLTSGDMVVFIKERRFAVNGWQSLVSHRIGYLRGQKSVELNLVPGGDAQGFSTLEQAFLVLNAGRIDAVVTTILAGLVVLRTEGLTDITFLSPPLQEVPVYHYLNVKRESLVAPLTRVLNQMEAEGFLAQVRQEVLVDLLPREK